MSLVDALLIESKIYTKDGAVYHPRAASIRLKVFLKRHHR
jgi:hypothetical protein